MVATQPQTREPRSNAPLFAVTSTALLTLGPLLMLMLFAPAGAAEPNTISAADFTATGPFMQNQPTATFSVRIDNIGTSSTSAVDSIVFSDPGSSLAYCSSQSSLPSGWNPTLAANGDLKLSATGSTRVTGTIPTTFTPCFTLSPTAGRTVAVTVTASGPKATGTSRGTTSGVVTLGDIFGLNPASQTMQLVAGITTTTMSVTMSFARSVTTTLEVVDADDGFAATMTAIATGSTSSILSLSQNVETAGDDSRTVAATLEVVGGTYDAFAEPITFVISEAAGLVRTDTRSTQLSESSAFTTQTIEVRLAKPALAGPVYVGVQTPDSQLRVLSDALLTFDAEHPTQEVVVQAIDDDVADATDAAAIVLSVKPGSSSEYLGKQLVVGFTVASDDTRGVNVELGSLTTSTSMQLDEGATTEARFSLTSQPTGTVAVDIVSQLPVQGTATPAQLVFTPSDWATTKSVTLKAVQDTERELTTEVRFNTVVHNSGARDSSYDTVDIADLTLSVRDTNDKALRFTSLTGSTLPEVLTLSEGGSVPAKVSLAFRPDDNVRIGVALGSGLTAATTSFLFTPSNWNTPQSLGITAVADGAVRGTVTTSLDFGVVDALTEDGRFWNLPIQTQSLALSIGDVDVPGLVVGVGDGLALGEAGPTMDTFTVRLAAKPASTVNVAIEAPDTRATVDSPVLTFTPANWATSQTVGLLATGTNWPASHLAAVHVAVTASSDVGYLAVAAQDLPILLLPDAPAMLLSKQAGTLTEGASDTFTVRLAKTAASTVTVTLTADAVGLERLSFTPSTLTFVAGSQAPQTVSVTGRLSPLRDATLGVPVLLTATGDATYVGKTATVTWTVNDRDPHALILAGPGSVAEGATASVATVRLNAQPTHTIDVVAAIVGGEATTPPTVYHFSVASGTVGSWDIPQTISVSGIADGLDDGSRTVSLQVAILTAGTDTNFAGATASTVAFQVTDVDDAGVEVPSSLTVTEGQSAGTVLVGLLKRPGGTVELQVVNPDTSELTITPATLTFNDSDFATKKTISVLAIDDDLVGAAQATTKLTLRIASGTVYGYTVGQTFGVTLVNTDNDQAGFTVSVTGLDTTVTENGATDTVGIRLTSRPGSDVVFSVATEAGKVLASPDRLTFSTTNFNVLQTVTLTGVNNLVAAGPSSSTVTFSLLTASSNAEFRSLAARQVAVRVLDDDAGLLLSGRTLSVTEGGAAATYTIALSRQPLASVTVTPSSTPRVALAPAQVVFTADNWQVAQTVSVTAFDDAKAQDEAVAGILHAITSTDNGFRLLDAATVSVTILDNDITVAEAQLEAYNRLLQDSVHVSKNPAGGNLIEFKLPPSPPAPVAGVQVFASNSPFVLVKTLDRDSAEYKSGRFVHVGTTARDSTHYLVTAYYGEASDLGFASSADPLGDIAGFETLGSGTASVAPASGFPAWAWMAAGAALLVVLVVVVVLVSRSRRGRAAPAGSIGLGWDDAPAPPAPAFAEALAGRAPAPAMGEPASCRCPACQTLFSVVGARPVMTACPGCGKKGVLR